MRERTPESSRRSLEHSPESAKVSKVIEGSQEKLGGFDIIQVGESGFLIQNQALKPMAGNDWVLFDYDDTLAAYTEVKRDRYSLYKSYLSDDLGMSIFDEDVDRVMKATDEFSRWEERQGEGKHYHAGAHMSALTWATELLKEHTGDINEAIHFVEEKLGEIKGQLSDEAQPERNDPFYFNNRRFILRTKRPWSKKIEAIFQETMLNPPTYEESIGAMSEIGEPVTSIHRFNVGVFTYGEPSFQLRKVLKLMEDNPDLPISQIWLTRTPKGEFIQDLLETKAVQKTELDYVPPELEDYPGDSISPPSGYPLSQTPHTLVMFDDDPKQLSNILAANDYLRDNSGAEFVVVRSIRERTKAQHRDWEVASAYGEIDFASERQLSSDVANIFRLNRFLTMSKNFPPDHPRVIAEKNYLEKAGVNMQELD